MRPRSVPRLSVCSAGRILALTAPRPGVCPRRVKPPPKEIEGDVFDRQRCIVGFDQGLVERQTCFVLGTGGIGQNVALTLARLGVKKIIMLDCDTCVATARTPRPALRCCQQYVHVVCGMVARLRSLVAVLVSWRCVHWFSVAPTATTRPT